MVLQSCDILLVVGGVQYCSPLTMSIWYCFVKKLSIFIYSVCLSRVLSCRVRLQSHLPEWADNCGGPGGRQRCSGHTKESACKIPHMHTPIQDEDELKLSTEATRVITPAFCWHDSQIHEHDTAVISPSPRITKPETSLIFGGFYHTQEEGKIKSVFWSSPVGLGHIISSTIYHDYSSPWNKFDITVLMM